MKVRRAEDWWFWRDVVQRLGDLAWELQHEAERATAAGRHGVRRLISKRILELIDAEEFAREQMEAAA